jgi:hypothetical protein
MRKYAARLFALIAVLSFYAVARPSRATDNELRAIAQRFRFRAEALPHVMSSSRRQRTVRPSLRPIASWISSVGAAVALHDLDGDGLPNDVCSVDVRTDTVVVAPVPGTSPRYAPFDLLASTRRFDRAMSAPMGCLPGDINEDGRPDLIVYFWGRSPLIFVRDAGAPNVTPDGFRVEELLTPVRDWYTNAAILADIDGDGHADLVMCNYFADGSRVLDAHATTPMQMQDSMSYALNGGGERVFLWHHDPSRTSGAGFVEAPNALPREVASGWTLAVGAQDLDGDLLPELYVANDFGPDHLLHNESRPGHVRLTPVTGVRRFADPKSKVLGRDSFKGMGVDFADVNSDGIPDIAVSNISETYALEESNFLFVSDAKRGSWRRGRVPFADRSEQLGVARSGWGWDIRFGDFDNDGVDEIVQATGFVRGSVNRWPELHELAMANDTAVHRAAAWPLFAGDDTDLSGHSRNPFFVRDRDGRYQNIASLLSADQGVSRGIATADVDGDGRLDYAVARQWDTSYVLHNESPDAGRAIELRLLRSAVPSSRIEVFSGVPSDVRAYPAIGAEAVIRVGSGAPHIAHVNGGNGHSGKSSPEIHAGLGHVPADAPVEVALRWREAHVIAAQRLQLKPGIWTIVLPAGVQQQ